MFRGFSRAARGAVRDRGRGKRGVGGRGRGRGEAGEVVAEKGEGSGAAVVRGQVEVLIEKLKGELVVSVGRKVWERAEDGMKLALVLRPLTAKGSNILLLASTLKKAWRMTAGVKFMEVPNGRVVVKFSDEASLKRVEEGGPWTFEGAAMPMGRWRKDVKPEEMSLDKIQAWVQIFNIPLHLLETEELDVATDVAQIVGRVCGPSSSDKQEVLRHIFARVKVEMDVNTPIRSGCFWRTQREIQSGWCSSMKDFLCSVEGVGC